MSHKKIIPVPVPVPSARPTVLLPAPASVDVLPPWHSAHDEQIAAMIVRHVAEVNAARQATEDARSVKRNTNRALTLLGAFVLSVVVTFALRNGVGGAFGRNVISPYSFAITIALDSSFTFYALHKRY